MMASMKLNHLGFAVRNIDEALLVYEKAFGYKKLSGPFDDPIQKVSVCFIGSGIPGELPIELVAPLGDDSPVHKILAKGNGIYHVCYEVDDIEKAVAEMRAQGCVVVSKPVPAVAFEGRKIAWFYTPKRQLVEVMEQ